MNSNTTSSASSAGQHSLKTYQVLDAIKTGGNQIPLICNSTGLTTRTVNALIYALEKQGRVRATSYKVRRGEQVFKILRYEPDLKKGTPRVHPNPYRIEALEARSSSKSNASFQALRRAFSTPTAAAYA